ncbi:hypothetical protein [Pantoea cypripedii]|uniref:Uncharacterized protein n=1 Tax=Pantoea cypripedii TaxID=55209 RepID=A0A1X1EM92_PANCY|nr:hypothetical protein [Pantoea cypripedii]MBP2200583.1 hypothetical protein [Pantoea cypripedii]ORM90080.1 hypothetical protein HA50_26270 [Pantoea cypripedii]
MKNYPDMTPRLWPPTEEQLVFWRDQTGREGCYEEAYAQWLQEKCGGTVFEKNASGGFSDTGCALLNGLLALSVQSVHQYRLIISTPPDPERNMMREAISDIGARYMPWEVPDYDRRRALQDKVNSLLNSPVRYTDWLESRGEAERAQWVMWEKALDPHQWPDCVWKFRDEYTRTTTARTWLRVFHDFRPDPGRSYLAVMMQTLGQPEHLDLHKLLRRVANETCYGDLYGGATLIPDLGLTYCIYPALSGAVA